jgi:hypothetical protein
MKISIILAEILISMIWMKLLFHRGKQVKHQSNAKDDICKSKDENLMIWMKSLFHKGNQSVKHHINEKDDMSQG